MQDHLWKSAFEIFDQAEPLPPAERQSFVASRTSDRRVIGLVTDLLTDVQHEPPDIVLD
jgi:hypothetical protein